MEVRRNTLEQLGNARPIIEPTGSARTADQLVRAHHAALNTVAFPESPLGQSDSGGYCGFDTLTRTPPAVASAALMVHYSAPALNRLLVLTEKSGWNIVSCA